MATMPDEPPLLSGPPAMRDSSSRRVSFRRFLNALNACLSVSGESDAPDSSAWLLIVSALDSQDDGVSDGSLFKWIPVHMWTPFAHAVVRVGARNGQRSVPSRAWVDDSGFGTVGAHQAPLSADPPRTEGSNNARGHCSRGEAGGHDNFRAGAGPAARSGARKSRRRAKSGELTSAPVGD